MYDEYHKNEEDIQKILRYLQIHDPKNANREYAIQREYTLTACRVSQTSTLAYLNKMAHICICAIFSFAR